MFSEYKLGINSEGREMFIPEPRDITETYQYKLGKDEWVPIFLSLKNKYKLNKDQFESMISYTSLLRGYHKKQGISKHTDYYKQITVEFIKETFVNA